VSGVPQQQAAPRSRHEARHSRTITAHIVLDRSLCEACWSCVEACPQGVLGKVRFLWHKHAVVAHAERCTGCRRCLGVCASAALSGADG
jgi:2-oxoglutarate ferredoxin oxidoreductase subunit delta